MAKEISRRSVGGGPWHTGVADEDTGGGGGASWQRVATVRWFDFVNIFAFIPNVTGGTFTLTANGETTAPIAWDASYADYLAALQALADIGAEGVTLYDESNGGFTFALGVLDANVTGDASGLDDPDAEIQVTGGLTQNSDDVPVWEIFTLEAGDVLDNALCVRTTLSDSDVFFRLTDDPDGGGNGSPAWSAPYAGAGESSGWDWSSGDNFTNLAGPDDATSASRAGARQISYSSDVGPDEWYVTLPALAKATTPIYLVAANAVVPASEGEADFLVKVQTVT